MHNPRNFTRLILAGWALAAGAALAQDVAIYTDLAIADAYVRDGSTAGNNFGISSALSILSNAPGAGPQSETYVKFNVAGVSNAGSVVLGLWAKRVQTNVDPQAVVGVFDVADTNWGETAICWTNRPAMGACLGTNGWTDGDTQWREIDVTSYVRQCRQSNATLISLGLRQTRPPGVTNAYVSVHSREFQGYTNTAPRLVWVRTNVWPTAVFTAPAPGLVLASNEPVTLSAAAADSDGTVTNVEFYVDGALAGMCASAPYSLVWSNPTAGIHALSVRAVDNFGGASALAASSLEIVAPGDPTIGQQIVARGTNITFADAHVRNQPVTNVNFGTETQLKILSNAVDTAQHHIEAYLKFDTSTLSNIGSARLGLFAVRTQASTEPSTTLGAYSVADTNWTELGIVWTNKPPMGECLDTNYWVDALYLWRTFDVTRYVQERKLSNDTMMSIGVRHAFLPAVRAQAYMMARSREFNQASNTAPQVVWTRTNVWPAASFTAPSAGLVLTNYDPVTLTATASDADGTVTNVEFYADGYLIGSRASAPYSLAWTPQTLGEHVLWARAVDNLGAASVVAERRVRVTNPKIDADLNGVADIFEDISLAVSEPFMSAPFVATGAVEAEQFDKGGNGVGYYSQVDNGATSYRVTRVSIEPCTNDTGAGYKVTKTLPGDWLKYTFVTIRPGLYTVEARVAGATNAGGVFEVEFGRANGSNGFRTQPMTVPSTQWSSVASEGHYLEAGTNYIKVLMVTNSSEIYVGEFNYLSIFPTVTNNAHPSYTVTVTGLVEGAAGTNLTVAQTNSYRIQQAVNSVVANGGGVVEIPAGTYYMAQAPDDPDGRWEIRGANGAMNYAVRILGSNVKITGSRTNVTFLQAHNRSATLLYAHDGWSFRPSFTNLTFEHLTFQGAPHTRTNGVFEPGWLSTAALKSGFDSVGSFIVFGANWGDTNHGWARQIVVQNCVFKNTTRPIRTIGSENVLIRSNRFEMYTGEYPHGLPVGAPLSTDDGVTFDADLYLIEGCNVQARAHVGIFATSATNWVVVDNYYDGSGTASGAICYTNADHTDGILWAQDGGNVYVARNVITNYDLEGVQINGGPGAVVGNYYSTFPYMLATCALNLDDGVGRGVTGNDSDLSFAFIGNYVKGGRNAVLASLKTNAVPVNNNTINISGNDVQVNPPWDFPDPYGYGDGFGGLCYLGRCSRLTVSGNTHRGEGSACQAWIGLKELDIFANDLRGNVTNCVSLIFSQDPAASAYPDRAVIANNLMSPGAGAHLRVEAQAATNVFLLRNACYDAGGTQLLSAPILSPANAPVNIQK